MKNLNITLKELVNILNKESKKLVGAKFDDRYLFKNKNISGKHKLAHGIINEILKQKELDNVVSANLWSIRIKYDIITPYGIRLLSTDELIEYRFKIKEDKRIKYGSAGIIESIDFTLVKGIDGNLTLNDVLFHLSIKEIQEWINLNEDKIARLKEDLKHAEKEKGTAQQQFEEAIRHELMDFAESMGIKINRTKGYKHSHVDKDIYVQEKENAEREQELNEKEEVLKAKEILLQNQIDDFDYKIEHLEELEKQNADKKNELDEKEKILNQEIEEVKKQKNENYELKQKLNYKQDCLNKEEIKFVEIAGIAHKGNFYAILQPVELLEGMNEDEALVFKVTRGQNGEDKFEIELDDEIINAVFKTYYELLDKTSK